MSASKFDIYRQCMHVLFILQHQKLKNSSHFTEKNRHNCHSDCFQGCLDPLITSVLYCYHLLLDSIHKSGTRRLLFGYYMYDNWLHVHCRWIKQKYIYILLFIWSRQIKQIFICLPLYCTANVYIVPVCVFFNIVYLIFQSYLFLLLCKYEEISEHSDEPWNPSSPYWFCNYCRLVFN